MEALGEMSDYHLVKEFLTIFMASTPIDNLKKPIDSTSEQI